MCNIVIYFSNIHIKHLQHTSETSETLEIYACNMRFHCNISLPLGRMEARQHVEFTGGAELAVPVEKTTIDPVEKAVAGRSGEESRRKAWWRGRRARARDGEREA